VLKSKNVYLATVYFHHHIDASTYYASQYITSLVCKHLVDTS
jgi:hypothetical protein